MSVGVNFAFLDFSDQLVRKCGHAILWPCVPLKPLLISSNHTQLVDGFTEQHDGLSG